MLGRAFGGEAQHGHARVIESGNALGSLRGADGNLCELVGIRHGGHGHITYNENTILAVLWLVGNQQHGTADTGDARCALDDLQGGAQGFAGGREGT